MTPVLLQGQQACLEPLMEEHAAALYTVAQSPEVWSYLPSPAIRTPGEMETWIAEALAEQAQGTALPFAIRDLASERINTECKFLLLSFCFETLGLIRVQFKTDGRNLRSQKAIERLGATQEGILRHHRIMPDGYLRDSVYYSILAEEWPMVKDRLQRFLT